MARERAILGSGAEIPGKISVSSNAVSLNLSGRNRNVNLKISDVTDKMAANLPELLVDLIEIATYVYCVDQAVTRGGNGASNEGQTGGAASLSSRLPAVAGPAVLYPVREGSQQFGRIRRDRGDRGQSPVRRRSLLSVAPH